MTNHGDIDPGASPDNGFTAIRQALHEELADLRPTDQAEDQHLNMQEIFALQRVASRSILSMLEEQGVTGAEALAAKLAEEAAQDPTVDMAVVANQYESVRTTINDVDTKAELEKLSRLANVVHGAALAAVVGDIKSDHTLPMVISARTMILQHGEHIEPAAINTISGLLDDIEFQASVEEPEA